MDWVVIHTSVFAQARATNGYMQDALQKFKEIVDSAKTIAVRTGKTADISKILSSYILHSAFLELGKQSSVDIEQTNDIIKNSLSILFGETKKNFEIPEHTLIKIDTEKIPVSELKYEKEGSILKIILESQINFDAQKIVVEKEKVPVDLLLLLDPEEKQIEEITKNVPHKEIVKITDKEKNISVKVFEILKNLDQELSKKFKEALWILLENENLFSKNIAAAKKEILEMNPSILKISDFKEAAQKSGFWKLLGRALQRSEMEKESGTLWTFVTPEDFEKTSQNENSALQMLNEIKKIRMPQNFIAILWQKNKEEGVKAILSGEENFKLRNLATQLGSAVSSSYFFAGPFKNFSEAEGKIRSEIKKVLQ